MKKNSTTRHLFRAIFTLIILSSLMNCTDIVPTSDEHLSKTPDTDLSILRKEAEQFLGEGLLWLKPYFNVPNIAKPQIFFDLKESGQSVPTKGMLFFHQPTGKMALYLDPKTPLHELKSLMIHELTHHYQVIVEGEKERKAIDNLDYTLGDYNFARNIIREGQADYLANLWSNENNYRYSLRDIEKSLEIYKKEGFKPFLNIALHDFRYSFGYEFFNKISQGLDKIQLKSKHEQLIKNLYIDTTYLMNEYLDIKIKNDIHIDSLKNAINYTFPQEKIKFFPLGALNLIFFRVVMGQSFEEASALLKDIESFSGILSQSLSMLVFSSPKSHEIIQDFLKRLGTSKGSDVLPNGIVVEQADFNDTVLTFLMKGNKVALIQAPKNAMRREKLDRLAEKLNIILSKP